MTDKEILIKLMKIKLDWTGTTAHKIFKRKYGISHRVADDGLIYDYALKRLHPILPEDEEIIKRSDWDLDGLVGQTEKQLFHPHYDILKEHIFNNHKRQHDILVIFECSNAKPYNSNKVLNWYMKKYKDVADFACISNPGIIPMEYSNYYPYRYDEWDHFKETKEIEDLYVKVNTERFFEYVKHFGYKEVIVCMQHPRPRRLFDEMSNPHIHLVIDNAFQQMMFDKYIPVFGHKGLIYSRMLVMRETKNRFDEIISKLIR